MGNVLFDKHMSVRRDAALPRRVSYPRERRRAGRVTESIDLIAAYPQMVLGGNILDCLKHVMLLEERESLVR